MRNALVMYPIKRLRIPTGRRKSSRDGCCKMLGKLDAASDRLARSRRRR